MRAGEQPARGRVGPFVHADDVAHRIDVHRVEAAVVAHPRGELRSAGAVRIGEVGDGELAALGIAGVAVLRQRLGPVPHLLAEHGNVAELFSQADLRDAVDIAQRLGVLELGVVVDASRESLDDLAPRQAAAARAAHREDEGEAELFVVGRVEPLQRIELFRSAIRQPGAALFAGRFGGERLGHHRLAREFGVGADQPQLRLDAGVAHHLGQREFELRQACKRPLRRGLFGDPRRVFVGAVQQAGKFGLGGGIELFERERRRHGVSHTKAVAGSKG